MPFAPNVGDRLDIDGTSYEIAEHPAAPRMPFGQEGREAIVYQLLADSGPKALKVFRPAFVRTESVQLAAQLQQFAGLPGLTVCNRRVLTATQHAALLQQHDDLKYAALMPWIEGPTWQEVLLLQGDQDRPLAPDQALRIARALATVLVRMEEAGVAHCDLSAPNVMLPMLEGGAHAGHGIELIDVESLYCRGIPPPARLPAGSSGYGHRTVRHGMWAAEADRFAGAVLLAEALALSDPQAFSLLRPQPESVFRDTDLQVDGPAYQAVWAALHRWDAAVANLFYRAWISQDLRECPTFGEWHLALARLVAPTRQSPPPPPTPPVGPAYPPARTQAGSSQVTQPSKPRSNVPAWIWGVAILFVLVLGGGLAMIGPLIFDGSQSTPEPQPTSIVVGGDAGGTATDSVSPGILPTESETPPNTYSATDTTPIEGNRYFGAELPPSQVVALRLVTEDCSDAVDFSISWGIDTLHQELMGSQRVDACTQSLTFSTGEGGPATITVGNKADRPAQAPRAFTLTSEGFEFESP